MLSSDYDILTASDGRQAINIMNSEINNIATVLLDLVMPEVDGFYVLNIMKTNLLHYLNHEPLEHVVNKKLGY